MSIEIEVESITLRVKPIGDMTLNRATVEALGKYGIPLDARGYPVRGSFTVEAMYDETDVSGFVIRRFSHMLMSWRSK